MTTIVLVDDDEADLFILREAFTTRNPAATIQSFGDVDSAVSALGRLVDGGEEVIVFTDLKMQVKGGLELIKHVRADPSMRAVPVVVLSTSTHLPDCREAYEAGASAYHVKALGLDLTDKLVDLLSTYWQEGVLRS